MRCEYCDQPKATQGMFDSHDDGCECAECGEYGWECDSPCDDVDWRDRALRAEAELSEWRARTGCQSPDRYVEASGLRTVAQLVERIGQLGRAEAEVRAMQAEAEQWARVGWRDLPEMDVSVASGCNRAAEAILAVKEQQQ